MPVLGQGKPIQSVQQTHQMGHVALKSCQQVVHHFIGQKYAAAVGLAAQRSAGFGFGQGLKRKHMAPAQPASQVVAQRQVHRRQAAGSRPLNASSIGFDEQREGRLLVVSVECVTG